MESQWQAGYDAIRKNKPLNPWNVQRLHFCSSICCCVELHGGLPRPASLLCPDELEDPSLTLARSGEDVTMIFMDIHQFRINQIQNARLPRPTIPYSWRPKRAKVRVAGTKPFTTQVCLNISKRCLDLALLWSLKLEACKQAILTHLVGALSAADLH